MVGSFPPFIFQKTDKLNKTERKQLTITANVI